MYLAKTLTGSNGLPYWHIEKRNLSDGALVWERDSGQGFVSALTIDSQYLYVVGLGGGAAPWRIEKHRLSDGALVWKKVDNQNPNLTPYAIAVDSQHVYITAKKPLNVTWSIWHIEKRNLSDGALVWERDGVYGTPLAIAVDSQYMYVGGLREGAAALWHIEKRNLSDGALVWERDGEYGTPLAIAVDSQYMYVGGYYGLLPAYWRIEKHRLSDGALVWKVEATNAAEVTGLAIDSQYMYVVGIGGNAAPWRIEKRNLSDGSLIWQMDFLNAQPSDIAIDSKYMYVVGYDLSPTHWRIEKRNLSDGALVWKVEDASEMAKRLAIDAHYAYVVFDRHIEKRWLTNGNLVCFDTQTCADGTPAGQCVPGNPPQYCDANANLVDNCTQCNCPSGYSCDTSTGTCTPAPSCKQYAEDNPSVITPSVEDTAFERSANGDFWYVVGYHNNWRIEKWRVDGGRFTLCDAATCGTGFGDAGSGIVTEQIVGGPEGVALDMASGVMYLAGTHEDASTWRVERRQLSTGALFCAP
ncbi:hypothetical protein D6833_07060 [Candidatus Parcubacteria bacterium]|nr:MAG: hypothetical protein D6833_07060 [Candidatus Parcubacteria bacterium]